MLKNFVCATASGDVLKNFRFVTTYGIVSKSFVTTVAKCIMCTGCVVLRCLAGYAHGSDFGEAVFADYEHGSACSGASDGELVAHGIREDALHGASSGPSLRSFVVVVLRLVRRWRRRSPMERLYQRSA